jgi:hypothetical protein
LPALFDLIRKNISMLGDTETGVRVTGSTLRGAKAGVFVEDVRPAQGVPATVQPVPETWAAYIQGDLDEPVRRVAARGYSGAQAAEIAE